jgi:hypothetical protein
MVQAVAEVLQVVPVVLEAELRHHLPQACASHRPHYRKNAA